MDFLWLTAASALICIWYNNITHRITKFHYISFSWRFYPKRLTISASTMRVQTQNNKNQESAIFFKKAKLQSAVGKCHVSATKVLFFFTFLYPRCSQKRCVFSLQRKMCTLSVVLMSLGRSFHVDGLGCKVWPCPRCRLGPIRSQQGTQELVFWNICGQLLVTSEGSGGAE